MSSCYLSHLTMFDVHKRWLQCLKHTPLLHLYLCDGSIRLRCTKWKRKDGGCKCSAKLDAAEVRCSPGNPHNHDNNEVGIARNEFKNALKRAIVSWEVNIQTVYDDLASIYAITHHPHIRQLVSPGFSVQHFIFHPFSTSRSREGVRCLHGSSLGPQHLWLWSHLLWPS